MKLLGNTKINLPKTENGKNMPYLQINEIVLVYFNLVNSDYQNDSKVLCTFAPNKAFGQLLDILPKTVKIFLKNFLKPLTRSLLMLTFSLLIKNLKPLEIEDKINTTLAFN